MKCPSPKSSQPSHWYLLLAWIYIFLLPEDERKVCPSSTQQPWWVFTFYHVNFKFQRWLLPTQEWIVLMFFLRPSSRASGKFFSSAIKAAESLVGAIWDARLTIVVQWKNVCGLCFGKCLKKEVLKPFWRYRRDLIQSCSDKFPWRWKKSQESHVSTIVMISTENREIGHSQLWTLKTTRRNSKSPSWINRICKSSRFMLASQAHRSPMYQAALGVCHHPGKWGRSMRFRCICASCCGGRFFGNLKNLFGQIQGWWHLSSIPLVNHVETTWLRAEPPLQATRHTHGRPPWNYISARPQDGCICTEMDRAWWGPKIKGYTNSDKPVGKKFCSLKFKEKVFESVSYSQGRPSWACQRGNLKDWTLIHIEGSVFGASTTSARFPVKLAESSSWIDLHNDPRCPSDGLQGRCYKLKHQIFSSAGHHNGSRLHFVLISRVHLIVCLYLPLTALVWDLK